MDIKGHSAIFIGLLELAQFHSTGGSVAQQDRVVIVMLKSFPISYAGFTELRCLK